MNLYIKKIDEIIEFQIGNKLGSGGEGVVYAVDDNPNLCVKLYHT